MQDSQPQLGIKLITDNATLPTRGSPLSAGVDLYSAYDYIIQPGEKELIKTDLSVQIPQGYYGRIAPRSSVAWKHHIDVGAGVIDNDYRGNIGVVLFNHGKKPFIIAKNDRIAQLIMEKCCIPKIVKLDLIDDTARGKGGFGSTGK